MKITYKNRLYIACEQLEHKSLSVVLVCPHFVVVFFFFSIQYCKSINFVAIFCDTFSNSYENILSVWISKEINVRFFSSPNKPTIQTATVFLAVPLCMDRIEVFLNKYSHFKITRHHNESIWFTRRLNQYLWPYPLIVIIRLKTFYLSRIKLKKKTKSKNDRWQNVWN